MPMPLGAPFDSICAASIASHARLNAVSLPNDLSIKAISLSIVFGMPMTAIFKFLFFISS